MATTPAPASPRAIAVVPDGQRRWARAHGKSFREAYEIGAENIRQIIGIARDEGAQLFFVWGGSVENLKERPAEELLVLHQVYEKFLRQVRDEWMDQTENANSRFVHMGRAELLNNTERALIVEITEATKHRTGMVVALCLGYSGLDEQERALTAWKLSGQHGNWKDHLDLPRQGVPWQPIDLIIRTGEGGNEIVHDNEFLHGYRSETRLCFHTEFFPDVTPEMFRADLIRYRQGEQRRGA